MTLFLIGMMGTGKSTIGKILSAQIGLPFIDLDKEIIKNEERTIDEIFQLKGEKHFRLLETEALKKVENSVCACGGGIVLNNDNIKYINKKGISIFLETKIDELSQRIGSSKFRPLLKGDKIKNQLKKIWDQRKAKYISSANIIIQTHNKSPNDIAIEIKKTLHL